MVDQPNQGNSNQHPLYDRIPDPTGEQPMGTKEEFDAIIEGTVAAYAPRMFAVVLEYGDRVDFQIAAWGMAFEDHSDLIDNNSNVIRTGLQSPELALRGYQIGDRVRPHLVWVNPNARNPLLDLLA